MRFMNINRHEDSPLRLSLLSLNSQYIHSSLAPWCLVAGLSAYAKAPHEACVLEGTVNEEPSAVLQRLVQAQPQLLGISCTIWNIRFVAGLLPAIRESLPDCVLVLGGPEVSHRAQDALRRYPQVDYLIAGEGELPFARLVDALCGLGSLQEVPGLCYREGETLHIAAAHVHEQMQPSPYSADYIKALGGRIAYLETSRGCPYSCAFCLSGGEDCLRLTDLQRAQEDILLLANSGTKTIKFVDRTFNVTRQRAQELLGFIAGQYGKAIPEGLCFHFEIAGDLLDEGLLALVAAAPAGLFQFEIGLQSMDEDTLRRVRRKTDMVFLRRQVQSLIACGRAHVHLDLIAGLPGEGLEQFTRGFDEAFELAPHALQLGFLKLIHGSAMRRDPQSYPCLYDEEAPYQVRSTPWLSEEDLAELAVAERALDKLYNSGRFVLTLRQLTRGDGLRPYTLFLKLGQAILRAQKEKDSLSLEQLTDCVYHALLELELPPDRVRDLMLVDRLRSTPTSVVPGCLKRSDARLSQVKRVLKQRYPRPQGQTRAIALLYAGENERVMFCDYAPSTKNPVTGLYPAVEMTMKACLGEV